MQYIVCKNCGWFHFATTEEKVKENAKKIQDYIATLEKNIKNDYEGFSVERSVEKQKKCFSCSSNELRMANENEQPSELATIQSVIYKK